jgi:diaminopimelate epimerase
VNLPFYKLRIGRNDTILVNLMGDALPDEEILPVLVRSMCRRHRGIGANGLAVLLDHPEAGADLRYFSPRGEEIQSFFDPLLGAARFLFDSGFAGTRALTISTPGGIKSIEAIDSANFRISLSPPLDPEGNKLKEMISTDTGSYLSLDGKTYPVTPVVIVQLFGALFFDSDPKKGKKKMGKALAKAGLFAKEFHPLFIQLYSDDDISFWPWWDSGYGLQETSLAAGAAAVAAAIRGFTGRSLMTRCGKDDFYIEWKEPDGELLLTGGAKYVFTGDYYFDEEDFYSGGTTS